MTTSLLLIARALHYAAGMMLAGVVAFRWVFLLPGFAGETEETWQKFAPLFRRLNALFLGAAVVLVLSGTGLFWAVAAGMSGSSLAESLTADTLGAVFFQTQFGTVFQWRLGLAVVMAILLVWLTWTHWFFRRKRSVAEMAAGVVAAALATSFAWTGHAASSSGAGWALHLGADAVHLFVVAIWPTGLLPLALALACARRIDEPEVVAPMRRIVVRFSQVSLGIVGVLLVTGVINSWFMLGRVSALFTTTYGVVLDVKLFLFATILAVAAENRYRVVPRLAGNEVRRTFQRLERLVTIEFVLAALIIAVVSVLGTTPPPAPP